MLCAMLREVGTPARARAGFAGYFGNNFFHDHWVAEVWDHDRGWHLVDAQLASAPAGTYTDADIDPLTSRETRSSSLARHGSNAAPAAATLTSSASRPPA